MEQMSAQLARIQTGIINKDNEIKQKIALIGNLQDEINNVKKKFKDTEKRKKV